MSMLTFRAQLPRGKAGSLSVFATVVPIDRFSDKQAPRQMEHTCLTEPSSSLSQGILPSNARKMASVVDTFLS